MCEPSHLHSLLNTPWASSWIHPGSIQVASELLTPSWCYMRTFALVSGNRSPTRPPPTSTDEAMRMGMAFVMPTREPKIRFPNTAASLHRALQNPKPVPLGRRNQEEVEKSENVLKLIESPLCFFVHVSPVICKSYQICKPVLYSPPDSREWLSCDHIQGVPGRDAQAVVKAQHENHHGLAGAKPQEETADAWEDHRAAWLTYGHTKRKNERARVSAKCHSGDWCSTKS